MHDDDGGHGQDDHGDPGDHDGLDDHDDDWYLLLLARVQYNCFATLVLLCIHCLHVLFFYALLQW